MTKCTGSAGPPIDKVSQEAWTCRMTKLEVGAPWQATSNMLVSQSVGLSQETKPPQA